MAWSPTACWCAGKVRAISFRRPEEALALRLSPGTPVFRFNRIRYADDAPMALEYATIVASALPSLEAVDASLYEALERAGIPAAGLSGSRTGVFIGISTNDYSQLQGSIDAYTGTGNAASVAACSDCAQFC